MQTKKVNAMFGPYGVLELFFRHPVPPREATDLTLTRPPLSLAIELIANWQSDLPQLSEAAVTRTPPVVAFGAEYSGWLYAVAVWSAPISPRLNDDHTLELRRLAMCEAAPPDTASWMLDAMSRAIPEVCPEIRRLLAYDEFHEDGDVVYETAGWSATGVSWVKARRNQDAGGFGASVPSVLRQRWELHLR